PIRAANGDVHVDPEAVVSPDDVAQDLVVQPVMRSVDDALVLPAAPRMRAGGSDCDAVRIDERPELSPALGHAVGCHGEGLAAPRLDLDLGGDELADEMLVELGSRGGFLQLFETPGQLERVG